MTRPAGRPPGLTDKPRLLFLSQTLPYPPDSGVKVRTYHLLRELAQAFDVTALCFVRRTTTAMEPGVSALAEFVRVEAFPIPQEYDRLRWLRDHTASLLGHRVYTHFVYESVAYRARLTALLAEPWSLVHADSLDLAGYFPLVSHIPTACTHHDIQSVLLRRRASVTPAGARRWYLGHQAALMHAEEDRWVPLVAMNIVVSEVEATVLRRRHPTARVAVVPNGVDPMYFQPDGEPGSWVVFVGGSDWFPNRDGMLWFAREILPLIRRRRADLRVCWVGRVSDDVRDIASGLGVEVTGHVDDVRPFLRQAACVIVPLRVGGGTRIKILDAWAMGKAVVATTIGAEGLNGMEGIDLLTRDDRVGFAEAVIALVEDPSIARQLGTSGRLRVEREHAWTTIGERIRQTYDNILHGSGGPAREGSASTVARNND